MDEYKIAEGADDPEDWDVFEAAPTMAHPEGYRWIATFSERKHAALFVAALSKPLSNADPAPSQLGTVERPSITGPEGWIDVPGEPGALRRLKPGDRFTIDGVEFAAVPVVPTREMQRAYFDVIDKNMPRVTSDAKFGRHESNKEAWAAAIDAASK